MPSRSRKLRQGAAAAAVASTALCVPGSAHLTLLLIAAFRARRRQPPAPCRSLNFAVVIPAHNEERQIGLAVASVLTSHYPTDKLRVMVVADNCDDRTAARAESAGAEVWRRSDPDRRGKGFALAWAFEQLIEDDWFDAVAVVDADCETSPNLLGALGARLRDGADGAQAAYLIADPEHSSRAALRWAGFALFNVIRPFGRDALGLSVGLLGTGMAMSRELLTRLPWTAVSYAEDREQHMRWVLGGARVAFAREAAVVSPSPTTEAGSRSQEARWESGRASLMMGLAPQLAVRFAQTGNVIYLDAALEPFLPPQSLLLAMNLGGVASARVAGRRGLRRVSMALLAAQGIYIVGGLAAVEAPAAVWRALLSVPLFLRRRVIVIGSSIIGRGPSAWQRTPR